ncbi:energy-coupling factor transport system ATP-binding protein [Evansella vedderi]|uniref:Energy-coupling factor transport system ATP-binding protein n=1 Tax=Evansella vedderi TaxID=38282 RepID=A0ABT9ZXS1_9BACI|nr:energy-coupling factor transporter ATPase [Evansella vedderi]MDQ0256034.1 energy-coupling factor transport system ATP-binding protein [Evansella vedderi]
MEIIQMNNVYFRYRPSDKLVLKNINLTIQSGEWVSIVGHNGSGKSTLAKFMNALFTPIEGQVLVSGLSTSNVNNHTLIRRKVAMVFQNPDNQIVGPTVEDDVAFGLENCGVPYEEMVQRVQESINKMGLNGLELSEPHRLSGGQKQRVALAGAISMNPKILVLDEATSMLDPTGREEVIRYVQKLNRDENMTVITITHDLKEAVLSDRMVVMKDGAIIGNGLPSALLTNKDLLKQARLRQPFIYELVEALTCRGVPISVGQISEEELVKTLCKLQQQM